MTRRQRRIISTKDVAAQRGLTEAQWAEQQQMMLDQITYYGAMMQLPKNVIIMHIGGEDSGE